MTENEFDSLLDWIDDLNHSQRYKTLLEEHLDEMLEDEWTHANALERLRELSDNYSEVDGVEE